MKQQWLSLVLAAVLALGTIGTALADSPPPGQVPGQLGTEGQPGNQGIQH